MMVSVREIIKFIGQRSRVKVIGPLSVDITRIHSLNDEEGGGLSFCTLNYTDLLSIIHEIKAKAIICKSDGGFPEDFASAMVESDDCGVLCAGIYDELVVDYERAGTHSPCGQFGGEFLDDVLFPDDVAGIQFDAMEVAEKESL